MCVTPRDISMEHSQEPFIMSKNHHKCFVASFYQLIGSIYDLNVYFGVVDQREDLKRFDHSFKSYHESKL